MFEIDFPGYMPWSGICHCLRIHVCVHVLFIILTRTHEDMLLYRGGGCDTLGNSGFSGELVSARN